MVLLAAGGIGIAALLTDLIAVRLGSAALAGLPLLLLFTEPFTLSVSRGFVGTTLAFIIGVAGYLALLSSEGRDRIRAWEQADAANHYAPDTRPLAAAGRRVGAASVLLALCLPLFIPGLHTTRLFGGQPGIGGKGGGGGAAVGFPNPNVQLSQELHATKSSTVLTYTSTNPELPADLRARQAHRQRWLAAVRPAGVARRRSARGCPRRLASPRRPGWPASAPASPSLAASATTSSPRCPCPTRPRPSR